MFNMKTATIRDVQHHLSKVLAWVEQGEEVQITRRNRTIAKIIPAGAPTRRVALPAFGERARKIWGETPTGSNLSQIVLANREERV